MELELKTFSICNKVSGLKSFVVSLHQVPEYWAILSFLKAQGDFFLFS